MRHMGDQRSAESRRKRRLADQLDAQLKEKEEEEEEEDHDLIVVVVLVIFDLDTHREALETEIKVLVRWIDVCERE